MDKYNDLIEWPHYCFHGKIHHIEEDYTCNIPFAVSYGDEQTMGTEEIYNDPVFVYSLIKTYDSHLVNIEKLNLLVDEVEKELRLSIFKSSKEYHREFDDVNDKILCLTADYAVDLSKDSLIYSGFLSAIVLKYDIGFSYTRNHYLHEVLRLLREKIYLSDIQQRCEPDEVLYYERWTEGRK